MINDQIRSKLLGENKPEAYLWNPTRERRRQQGAETGKDAIFDGAFYQGDDD